MYYKPKLPVIGNLSESVGRDSHLDTQSSILENRPTAMIQFAQGLGVTGWNMLATSNLRYYKQKYKVVNQKQAMLFHS